MPEPPTPELKQFLEALENFGSKPPGDLPDGALEMAKELGQTLRGYTPTEGMTPGQREAVTKQGSDVPVEFSKAAVGRDQPSPGQREFADKARELAEMAGNLDSQH